MSRRCRASLQERASQGSKAGSGLDSGCDCGRLIGSPVERVCQEPIIYGTNILPDPGFETLLALTGGGPNGDEIAYRDGQVRGPFFWPSDDSSAYTARGSLADHPWVQRASLNTQAQWKISSANPNTGAFHARAEFDNQTNDTKGQDDLIGATFISCSTTVPQPFFRVNEGDLVSSQVSAMVQSVSANTEQLLTFLQFLDVEGNFLDFYQQAAFLTTSYVDYAQSAFAPPGTYYAYTLYRPTRANPGTAVVSTYDYDDIIVGVQPSGQNATLCVQNNLITIDNDTTETAFL